ncbi:alpha/beta hydrolase [Pigmentiphaga litoralis]|uniref:YheT family hydrolase n=1 Tax=Pigmentiphaga litoralis TaxID=516702 RepID=UPI00167BB7C8|nr:alpha/beta fold hydrolase [Pigmentiphaga litoralis]GGX29920.1 alpha/beta hydrolase [Pigmentiphaga litoralis]
MPALLDTAPCPSPRWLPEGHSQTIFAALFARHHHASFVRERVDTPDGDFIDLDWTAPGLVPAAAAASGARLPDPLPQPTDNALVLFHGLEGSSRSPYAQAMTQYFRSRGWTVVVPHFRGCSGEPNRLPRAYHSGDSKEIGFMLDTVRRRLPDARWHAVGVSLGGNALLKHLGEAGAAARWLTAAAGISAPVDLMAGGTTLGTGFVNRQVYTQMFLRTLKTKTLQKSQMFPGTIDILRVANARDLYEFDDAYTAPVHGFAGAADYWTRASSKPVLVDIAVPTLVLNARNDPFLPGRYLPGTHEASNQVLLHQPAQGGHVGFSSGRFPGNLNWLPQRIATYFRTGA